MCYGMYASVGRSHMRSKQFADQRTDLVPLNLIENFPSTSANICSRQRRWIDGLWVSASVPEVP
jgi:hypothetical protein